MRVFVAIDIDDGIKAVMEQLQEQLRQAAELRKGDANWVSPGAMHLTLKFLGQMKDNEAVEVCRIVEQAVSGHSRFDIEVGGVGSFGGSSARVLWVGIEKGAEKLESLQKDIEKALERAGWPAEARRFTGHLTLCRIKNFRVGRQLAEASKEFKDYHVGAGGVDHVTVYHSQLTPQGPVYTPLSTVVLR